MKSICSRAALAAALAFAGAAHAQVAAPDDAAIVVTASGVAQRADTIGQAITIIDRATIEQRQTVVLADLLATTPGVSVARNGGIGGVTSVFIRGADSAQTLVLIDGARVNDPSSPSGAFDFANLLAGSVDRVEVLRGPNSVPWGSQAIGGVVNVTTLAPAQGLQGRGNVEYGSHNQLAANAGISGSSGILSASLTGAYLRTDGISAYARGTEPDGYRQYGTTARVEAAFTPDLKLDLRGYYSHSRAELDGFPAPLFAFADDREYQVSRELHGYAGLHANFLDGRFRNTLSFAIADIHRDTFDRAANPQLEFFYRGRSKLYSYTGDVRPVDQVRLVFGAQHEDTHLGDDARDDLNRGVSSGWGEIIVTPVERLTLTGGVRYDDDDAFGGHTSWSANAVYALPTATTLRASYAQAFKAPTLYQLYAPFYGTRTLRPETARNYDIGVEQRLLGDAAVAGLTYFHRDTHNQIDFDARTFTYSNIIRARAEGVEFTLTLRPIRDLTITGEYSYVESLNRSPGSNYGKDLARRPRNTVSVSADYRLPFGLSVGGTILDVGNSYDNAANTTKLGGYTLVGFRAEMPVYRNVSIYGRVDNAFDAKYQTVATYGTYGRTVYGGIRVKFD